MRRSHLLIVAAAAMGVFLLPTYARSQVETTPIPAPSKPNFSSMTFMLGTWHCATKSSRRPAAYLTNSTYSLDSTGYWINETSTTPKTSWVTKSLSNWDRITYDADTHRWVDVSWGDGGAYGLSFSKGWDGNDMVWHDVSFAAGPDIASQSDITTTKVSSTKLTSTSSFTETKTGRKVSVSTVCTKT